MNVVIIDDEKFAVSRLEKILMEIEGINQVDAFTDPLQGLSYLIGQSADLLFLDIEMPKINGLYIAEQIIKIHPNIKICFVTGYDEYVVKAFELKAKDYIIKPYSKDRIHELVEHFQLMTVQTLKLKEEASLKEKLQIICVLDDEIISFIDVADILYFEFINRKTQIMTREGLYFSSKSLSYYEKRLSKAMFFRCHKSYLVNMIKVIRICPRANYTYDIVIEGSEVRLPISRIRIKELKKRLKL